MRANSSDKDVLFTFWFYSTNLHYFVVVIYKKNVEKLSISTGKKDVENEDRTNGKIVVAENPAILGNKSRKNIEEPGKSDLTIAKDPKVKNLVAEDLNRVNIENKSREDVEEDARLGIAMKDLIAKDLAAKNPSITDVKKDAKIGIIAEAQQQKT